MMGLEARHRLTRKRAFVMVALPIDIAEKQTLQV